MTQARRNLPRNVVFAIGEFAITTALVILTFRLVIAHGGLEALGVWATLIAWTALIRLGDAGLTGALLRTIASQTTPATIRVHIQTGLLANTALFAALSLAGHLLLAPFTPHLVGPDHANLAATLLPLICTGFFLANLSNTTLTALQGLHLGYRRSQLAVLGSLVALGLVFALVPQLGLIGLACAQIAQHTLTAALGWLLLRHHAGISAPLPLHFDRPAFNTLLSLGLRLQLAAIANTLFEPVSKILVGTFGGMETQGLYELAYKTVSLTRNLITAGLSAALPAMSHLLTHAPRELDAVYARARRLGTTAMLALTLCLLAGAPLASQFWLGEVNATYWLFTALIAAGFTLNTIGAPAYMLGIAAARPSGNIAVTTLSLVALLALGTSAGLAFGPTGTVATVGLCLAANGIAISRLNARLLPAGAAP